MNILVIDDEESIRFTFESFLRDEGYSVSTAAGCSEAILYMSQQEFDLIIADLFLQYESGLDILEQVKQQNPRCEVVIMTAYPSLETAMRAIRLGALDYMPKPVTQQVLLDAAQRAMHRTSVLHRRERYHVTLEAMFRSIQKPIILLDEMLSITDINEAAMRKCGMTGIVIGKPIREAVAQCSGQCIALLAESVRSKQPMEPQSVDCLPQRKVRVETSPLLDRTGTFQGVVMLVGN